ncbi:universal stress protein, partial [uncultured Succinivibrio sp.]|uniref:universal stress protein n=1 Tax=uncultured Succinivibrio sp. TaxID=540749 RepID=UPI0025D5C3BA
GGIASPQDVTNQLAEEFSKKHGVPLDHVHVLQGRVDEEIPRLCKKLNARMVCMGTTPRSSFFGSVNSSASELVLDQIHGDVFVVNAATLK